MLPFHIGPSRKSAVNLQSPALPGVLLLALCLPGVGVAQIKRTAGIDTSLDVQVGHVDGRRGDGKSGTEFTGEVRPGVRLTSRSGRVQGSLSYGLGLVHRSRATQAIEVQHRLSTAVTGQVIEDRLFVDVAADVSRQAISAYGRQSVAGSLTEDANHQDVGTLSISPSFRGVLAGMARYEFRLNAAGTNTRKSIAGDSTTTGGSFALSSNNPGARLGWSLNAASNTTDFRTSGDAINESASASLSLTPDPELSLSLRGGAESTNLGALAGLQTYSNWGATLRWSPSPRAVAEFGADRRFFGNSHNVKVSYRLPRAGVRFTSVRDVTLGTRPQGLGQPQTLYDLFFQQFASQEPDPVLRQQLVLTFLGGLGLDPNASVGGGSTLSGPTVQQRQDLAFSYALRRLTLAMQAFASRSTRLAVGGGLAPAIGDTRQRGYNGSLAWRLTPTASISLLGSRLMTQPTENLAGNDLKSLSLSLSERLGARATAAVSVRYTVFNSVVTPYRETAINASLGLRF